jgi:hypothetical protein
MRYFFSFYLLIFLLVSTAYTQNHTLTGFVFDISNGEPLLGANVYDIKTYLGTTTNSYGFYSLTLPYGIKEIKFSYVGYKPVIKKIDFSKDTIINIELVSTLDLDEVEITGKGIKQKMLSSQMSINELPMRDLKKIPVFFGETDIIKTIQLMPGVQSGSDGSSGLFVRGGGHDENLILLDGVPVYNVNHLFGFFSVFNADAINSVTLVKGGFPARYGGRLSSVLDIRMKEGNLKEFHGTVSVGLISAKATIEGPVVKDKSSFIITARRTYVDLLSYPVQAIINNIHKDEGKNYGGYYFFDLNGKINYKFSEKNRLYLSAYMGNDKTYGKFKYEDKNYYDQNNFKLRWGNITAALRWNHVFNNKLFANTRISYSRYHFNVGETYTNRNMNDNSKYVYDFGSGINDVAVSTDFDYIPVPKHYIRFGASYIFHTFTPGVNVYSSKEENNGNITVVDTTYGNSNIYASEIDAYIEDDFSVGNRIKINAGLHLSGFAVRNKFYTSAQPRASIRVLTTKNMSIKASYAMMQQYLHLLTNSSIGLPTDLWLPVTDTIKPMNSQQVALGTVYNIKNIIEVSVEGYYKWLNDLIDYKPGASFLTSNQSWEDLVTVGNGNSYGVEFMIKKNVGKLTGWIGYTLSWAWRRFVEVSPNKFPFSYDRRNDITIVITYNVNDHIDIGGTWVFGTGYPVTLPYDKYLVLAQDNYRNYVYEDEYYQYSNLPYIDNVEQRNNYKMANYHRLDLGINLHKTKKHGERIWSFGIYNAYFRQNPFFLFIDYDYDNYDGINQPEKVLKQVSLFPGIPYFSYTFKF